MITTAKDYTDYIKSYVPTGQKISLWENFLTGTQAAYSNIGQQVSEQAAYDISDAFANYKKQQLQLQMNQQLGAGFKDQVGSELQSTYESAFSDIKSQEATNLSKVITSYSQDVQTAEQNFAELGKLTQSYQKLLDAFGAETSDKNRIEKPANIYTKVGVDDEGNDIYEMADDARLWYYDVSNASKEGVGGFDQWLMSEESAIDMSLEDREMLLTQLRENPDLFKSALGIGSDFDAETTRTALQHQIEKQQKKAQLANKVSHKMNSRKDISNTYNDYAVGDAKQLNAISNDISNFTKDYTSTDAVVSVQSTYNSQRKRYHTTVKLNDSALTSAQRNAIRNEIGSYADAYLKNGIWTIKLSDDGKISSGEFGMSYSEYAKAMKKE